MHDRGRWGRWRGRSYRYRPSGSASQLLPGELGGHCRGNHAPVNNRAIGCQGRLGHAQSALSSKQQTDLGPCRHLPVLPPSSLSHPHTAHHAAPEFPLPPPNPFRAGEARIAALQRRRPTSARPQSQTSESQLRADRGRPCMRRRQWHDADSRYLTAAPRHTFFFLCVCVFHLDLAFASPLLLLLLELARFGIWHLTRLTIGIGIGIGIDTDIGIGAGVFFSFSSFLSFSFPDQQSAIGRALASNPSTRRSGNPNSLGRFSHPAARTAARGRRRGSHVHRGPS